MRSFGFEASLRAFLCDIHHVRNPGCNWLYQHLSSFSFEKGKHVEVAVALGSLSPEFPRNFDYRFHSKPINLNCIDAIATCMQCINILFAVEIVTNLSECA